MSGRRPRQSRPPTPPVDADAMFVRAVALEDAGDVAAARSAYREILLLAPWHVETCINLGRLFHEGGDVRGALELYESALRVAPGDVTAMFNLAVAQEDLRHNAKAISTYRRVLAAQPDHLDAHHNLAWLLQLRNRCDEALPHLQAVWRLTRGRADDAAALSRLLLQFCINLARQLVEMTRKRSVRRSRIA